MKGLPELTIAVAAGLLFILGLTYFQGCAWRQDSLRVPGVERVCTADYCFNRASADLVDRRCTKNLKKWDDGAPYTLSDGRRAKCCTAFRGWSRRFAIWVARGDEDCIPHEFCHVDEFLSGRNDHGRCHAVGWGKGGA